MSKETTNTFVQHADDFGRDISNAIIEWERRNPGKKVLEVHAVHNCDVMAPYLEVRVSIGWQGTPEDYGFDPQAEGEAAAKVIEGRARCKSDHVSSAMANHACPICGDDSWVN